MADDDDDDDDDRTGSYVLELAFTWLGVKVILSIPVDRILFIVFWLVLGLFFLLFLSWMNEQFVDF